MKHRPFSRLKRCWGNLGITRKFTLIFSVMLCFILVLCGLAYAVLSGVHGRTVADIQLSFNIRKLVLEMDRSIEKARRLKHEFMLNYERATVFDPDDGFAARVYAQLEEATRQSRSLNALISRSDVSDALRESHININLYYSIAHRCEEIFRDLVALMDRMLSADKGLIKGMETSATLLRHDVKALENKGLSDLFLQTQFNIKDYLLTRRRPFMQSALNSAFLFNKVALASNAVPEGLREGLVKRMDAHLTLARQIPELDVTIQSKSKEFDLNTETLEPISAGLMDLADREVEKSQARNARATRRIGYIMALAALAGFVLVGVLSMIIRETIAGGIVRLTRLAGEVEAGNLAVQDEAARHQPGRGDELGRLSRTFNRMTRRLRVLVEDLESQVAERTRDLVATNTSLKREIIERKAAEREKVRLESQLRQAHKMEAIGTLAGGIAHDFNNILGIIMGNAELAIDDVPEWNPALRNLREIITASARARDIVRQLLSFSRKTEQEKRPIRMEAILQETLSLLRATIPSTVEIRYDVPENLPAVRADRAQIHQVIINLCANAAHAMDAAGGILEVGLRQVTLEAVTRFHFKQLAPGRYIEMTISDTGDGIDPGIIDKIFDPYFTTREVGKGTGMGLAIVHGIVSSHDGAISVYSEPGKGTAFRTLLPVAGEDAAMDEAVSGEPPGGHERILLVDDEPGIVEMGRQILQRLGYRVDIHTDPLAALEAVRGAPERYQLVITDMTMPRMTGDALTRQILAIRPDMPVILCTGFSKKINGDAARAMGIRRYIEKPLDRRELAMAAREALDEPGDTHSTEAKQPKGGELNR